MADAALLGGYPYAAQSRNPFNYSKVEQINRDVVTEWLTLNEITQQLNLFMDESQDTYLLSLELATRFAIEDYLGLSIFPVTYRVYYGGEGLVASPSSLDLPEVSQNLYPSMSGVTINSLGYYSDGTPSVFTQLTGYYYDPTGNKVILASLPSNINTNMTAPIVMEYTTAANPLQTYPVIKQAALLLLTHLYNNRSNTTDVQLKQIPFGVATLLRPYKPLVM
tara:strand:- start:23383 stop:24048 length:666 start_codon:yes stop_codon:yes gene_type:complete